MMRFAIQFYLLNGTYYPILFWIKFSNFKITLMNYLILILKYINLLHLDFKKCNYVNY
jgi:hypothetical protein